MGDQDEHGAPSEPLPKDIGEQAGETFLPLENATDGIRSRGSEPEPHERSDSGDEPNGPRVLSSRWWRAARSKQVALIVAECALVLAMAVSVFYKRLLELEPIEIGGDALKVWEFARHLVHGGAFPDSLNHHTARFGLVIPTILSQWFFGSHATTYYIGPLVAAVLLHVWVYLIGRTLSGPVAGAAGVASLLVFEPVVRASSQILPEAFGPMYVAFAVYATLQYSEAESRAGRWLWLSAGALGLILSYGSKLSYLYFAPGLALLVWFGGARGSLLGTSLSGEDVVPNTTSRWRRLLAWSARKKLVVPGVLTFLVLLLIGMETVLMSAFTESTSQFDVANVSHGGGGEHGPRIRTFADFFLIYTRAPAEWVQAFTAGILALLGVFAFSHDKRSKLIGLMLVVYVLLQTFVVRRLSPLTLWFEPHPRYLLALIAPLAVVMGVFVGDAFRSLAGSIDLARPRTFRANLGALTVAGCVMVAALGNLPEQWNAGWGKHSSWHRMKRMESELSAAFQAGLPIVSDSPKGKPAWAAAALFIDPKLLFPDGNAVGYGEYLRRYEARGSYVARAVRFGEMKKSSLDNAVVERGRRAHCAVMLRQSVRFVSGRMTFSPDCQSLEDEFKTNPDAGKASWRKKEPKRAPRRPRGPKRAP